MIRLAKAEDLPELERIHRKFYNDEFPFPFSCDAPVRQFLDKYIVENDEGKIITFGAIELNAEMLMITNKELGASERREAIYTLFQAILFSASQRGFDRLQCTVLAKKWEQHLKRVGWQDCKGKFLTYKV